MNKIRILVLVVVVFSCAKVKKEYYDSGKLKEVVKIRNGKRNGKTKILYPSGKLLAKINYKNGKKNGQEYRYYQNGNIKLNSTYINGRKNGVEKKYYESGEIEYKFHYRNDSLFGENISYYKNGVISEKRYYDRNERIIERIIYDTLGNRYEKYLPMMYMDKDTLDSKGDSLKIDIFIGNTKKDQNVKGEFILTNKLDSKYFVTDTLDSFTFFDKHISYRIKAKKVGENNYCYCILFRLKEDSINNELKFDVYSNCFEFYVSEEGANI